MSLPGPESRARQQARNPEGVRPVLDAFDRFLAQGKAYAPDYWDDVQRSLSARATTNIRRWDDHTIDTYWRLLSLGDAFGYWTAAQAAGVVATRLAEVGPARWQDVIATIMPGGGGRAVKWLVGGATGGSRLARLALDLWYHPVSRLIRLASGAAGRYEAPGRTPATAPPGQSAVEPGMLTMGPLAAAGQPGVPAPRALQPGPERVAAGRQVRGGLPVVRRSTLPGPRYDFRVRPLPGEVTTGPGGRMDFPGVEITARPRPGPLAELARRLTATPGPIPRGRAPIRVAPPSFDPRRVAPGRFDFTVRELPGQVRVRPGGRMEFPGVEITAHLRQNPLRDMARGLEGPARHAGTNFDWTVRQLPGSLQPGPRGRMDFPGVEITATPRPNLLGDLGQRLQGAGPGARYDFRVRQLPGPVTPRPGGGMQFPPIEVTATPMGSSGNLLHDLGQRLSGTR